MTADDVLATDFAPIPAALLFVTALAAHGPTGTVNSREGWIGCTCGERLSIALDSDGYAEDYEAEKALRDAHVAADVERLAGVLVAAARAEAWDQGWNVGYADADTPNIRPNPYRGKPPGSPAGGDR